MDGRRRVRRPMDSAPDGQAPGESAGMRGVMRARRIERVAAPGIIRCLAGRAESV